MHFSIRPVRLISTLLFLSLPFASAQAAEYESPVVLSAAKLLPDETLNNAAYQLDDKVPNDGFMNHYTVTSEWGEWQISSNALLGIRLAEIIAMTEMRKIEEGDSMENALEEDVKEVGDGVVALVEDPVAALEGTVSGVKKMFALTGESWKSRHTRKDQSALASLGNTVSGFSKAKREYAAKFGVDPYSSNQDLQLELERIARAASGGAIIGMVAKAFIPGGLGVFVSASGISHSMNELLTTSSEVELRIVNREKMQKMGVDAKLIEQFLDDGSSSTSYKTYIIGALEQMPGVKGRDLYINYGLSPPSEDVALFRARSALMYAARSQKKPALDRFLQLGETVIAIDTKNNVVAQLSLDHLLWTKTLAVAIDALDKKLVKDGDIKEKQLSITGTASEITIAEFNKRGWRIEQKVTY